MENKFSSSVYKLKSGTWGFRYCVRSGGKSIYKRCSVDHEGNLLKTKKDAERARSYAIAQTHEETFVAVPTKKIEKKTVEDVFFEYCKKGRLDRAYATKRKQDSLWENHIKDRFGSRYVDEIAVSEVQDYLTELYYGNDYSYQYVESFLKMFYLIFGQANGRGYLDADTYSTLCRNRLTKIHMPKLKFDEDTDIHVFDKKQLALLDEYFTGTNLELAYMLGRYCGLRINECFGLKWSCIDLDKGSIKIEAQMSYQEGIIKLVSPKTVNSHRIIFLPDKLIAFLRKRQEEMKAEDEHTRWVRLRKARTIQDIDGSPMSSLELVNSLPDGTMQTNNSMKYHSRNIMEKYGFVFKYHYLRHTYGTNLAMLNTPTHVLCKQMGHGNIQVTEKYYIALTELGVDVLKKNLEQL